jgi:ATP synthase I chain
MAFDAGARKLNRIERDGLLILLGCALIAVIATGSVSASGGLVLGGALVLANFHFLWRFARRAMEQDSGRKGPFLAGIFFLFLLFLGAVAVCLLVLKVPLIPFFLGTLSLLASIFLNGIVFVGKYADPRE